MSSLTIGQRIAETEAEIARLVEAASKAHQYSSYADTAQARRVDKEYAYELDARIRNLRRSLSIEIGDIALYPMPTDPGAVDADGFSAFARLCRDAEEERKAARREAMRPALENQRRFGKLEKMTIVQQIACGIRSKTAPHPFIVDPITREPLTA